MFFGPVFKILKKFRFFPFTFVLIYAQKSENFFLIRYYHQEGGASSCLIRKQQLSLVKSGDFPGNTQTQAEMFLLAAGGIKAVKALNHPLFFAVRNPRAV